MHLRGCFRPLIPIDICTTRICHHSPLPRPFGLQSALLPQWASVYENWWWTRLRWGCDNHDTWGNYANCPDKAFISLPHYSLPCIIASHKRDKTRTLSLHITSDDTQQTSFFLFLSLSLSLSLSIYIYIYIYKYTYYIAQSVNMCAHGCRVCFNKLWSFLRVKCTYVLQ